MPDVVIDPAPLEAGTLRIIPIGGLGEVGRNMTSYEIDGKILIVDCGVLFPEEHQPGVDLILPDFGFLRERLDDIVGVVLTHGHEDHIGSVPYLLRLRPGRSPRPKSSAPGGRIAALLTEVPGLVGRRRARVRDLLQSGRGQMLGVSVDLIAEHGAVSEAVARAMAQGARVRSQAEVAVAVTGIAGPGGATATKPVGLVHFGLAVRGSVHPSPGATVWRPRARDGARPRGRGRAQPPGTGAGRDGVRLAAAGWP